VFYVFKLLLHLPHIFIIELIQILDHGAGFLSLWCSILNKIMIAMSRLLNCSLSYFNQHTLCSPLRLFTFQKTFTYLICLLSSSFLHPLLFSDHHLLQLLNYVLMNNNCDSWSLCRFYFSIKSSFQCQDFSTVLFHISIKRLFDHHYVFSDQISHLALIFSVSALSSLIIIYNKLLSSTFQKGMYVLI